MPDHPAPSAAPTGRERDAAVATALGWELRLHREAVGGAQNWYWEPPHIWQGDWRPSSDPAASARLRDELLRPERGFQIQTVSFQHDHRVRLLRPTNPDDRDDWWRVVGEARAPTEEAALAQAALLALQGEKP